MLTGLLESVITSCRTGVRNIAAEVLAISRIVAAANKVLVTGDVTRT